MSKIFLSYRRQDSAYVAQFIYERLRAHFGADAVFMDIDSIPIGADFREHITAAVDQCGILLALIGRNWAGETGVPRRIDDPRDFVRIEIEAALERKLPVIPILIDHARMPGETDLPPSLALLAYRNALDLGPGRDFHHNLDRLINGIERLLQRPNPATAAPPAQPEIPAKIIPVVRERERVGKPDPVDAGQQPKPPAALEFPPIEMPPIESIRLPSTADPRRQQKTNKKAESPSPSVAGESKPATSTTRVPSPEPAPPSRKTQPPSPQPTREWTNSIGIKFALIPAGTFLMGSTDADEDAWYDEKPQHEVRITRPFYLGVHEVTQGQYQAVMGQNPSQFKGSDDLPVERVSWLDAIRFCNKLSEREGRKSCYRIEGDAVIIAGGDGYRLPTEAEWEYACRAGTTTRFSFGDDENALGQYAWYSDNANRQTHPVGEKPPNGFGLYDMHGNVWEWCGDVYDAGYYMRLPAVDPLGPGLAAPRVIRGGSWPYDPRRCRSANRLWITPDNRDSGVGFRLARVQSDR
jgi:formylglycine-generating enzyme required for sulfatase activity